MNNLIDILENNNYESTINEEKYIYIFINKNNSREEIRLYYKNDVWYLSFPMKNSIYNYKTLFTSKNGMLKYFKDKLDYMFENY